MKLITYQGSGGGRAGVVLPHDGYALDIGLAGEVLGEVDVLRLSSLQNIIEAGPSALDAIRRFMDSAPEEAMLDLATTRLLSPLPVPVQIRDFISFEKHLIQGFRSAIEIRASQAPDPVAAEAELRKSGRFDIPDVWYQQPIYYKCNRFAVIGTDEVVEWPRNSNVMDYELEFAAIIGRAGRDISVDKAKDHIFGFTVFNDLSARDLQTIEMEGMLGPAKGKDFDGANVLGPCIVTADEIGDPYALEMVARINGEEWSRGNSSTMHWKFEDMIAHTSQSETIYPGEVLGSGTVGNGCGAELKRFLSSGDNVELEVEKIGSIRTKVIHPNRGSA